MRKRNMQTSWIDRSGCVHAVVIFTCGRTHQPAIYEVNGVLYCNTRDWMEHQSALLKTPPAH